jgi:regulatory protein
MSGRITALKIQKHNPQRVNVYLDDEYAFGLSRITAAWLYVNQELDDEKIAQLQADDAREVAHQRALRLLEIRPRSETEIRRSLNKHKTSEDVIEDVLERLKRSNLVNDQTFAGLWVENQREFRPRGRKALAYELRQRGVQEPAIRAALENIQAEDEEALAYRAAQKQLRKLRNLEWNDFRNKLGAFLNRRGFSYDVIAPVVQRTWQEIQNEISDAENSLENERQQL